MSQLPNKEALPTWAPTTAGEATKVPYDMTGEVLFNGAQLQNYIRKENLPIQVIVCGPLLPTSDAAWRCFLNLLEG